MTQFRSRHLRNLVPLCVLAIAVALWATGCDQGEGGRCQSQDDCASPLVCNLATMTCSSKTGEGQIDATVPDGPPADAAIDAPPDVMIDAMIDAI